MNLIVAVMCGLVGASDVPKPVLDSVARKYPGAKQLRYERETEEGKTIYEIQVLAGGHKIDVDVTPDGRIVEEEEEIDFAAAPEAVKKSLVASPKYGKWSVKRAEKITHADRPTTPDYELLVARGKDLAELVFAADGKLLKTEAKKPGDED
jgi:hypothetical protein